MTSVVVCMIETLEENGEKSEQSQPEQSRGEVVKDREGNGGRADPTKKYELRT